MTVRRLLLLVLSLVAAAWPATAQAKYGTVGAVGPVGCIAVSGAQGCANARIAGGDDLIRLPSGDLVNASASSAALGLFSVGGSGALAQPAGAAGCVESENGGTPFFGCRTAYNLSAVRSLVASPGGEHVYAGSGNGITAFSYAAGSGSAGGLSALNGGAVTSCLSDNAGALPGGYANTCTNVRSLSSVTGLAVTPDGRQVYAAVDAPGSSQDGVAVLQRDPVSGVLTQSSAPGSASAGCFTKSDQASGDADVAPFATIGCGGPGRGFQSPAGIAVSADGQSVFVVMRRGVVTLRRGAGGALSQPAGAAGCASSDPSTVSGDGCASIRGVPSASALALAGADLYVANDATPGVVAHLSVGADGSLSQSAGVGGCIATGGATSDSAVPCASARALSTGSRHLTVSPDGLTVAVSGAGGEVALLDRAADGGLTQAPDARGCISNNGTATDGGSCTGATGLGGGGIAFGPSSETVYVAGNASIAALGREVAPTCSGTTASTASTSPIGLLFGCSDLNGDPVSLRLGSAPAQGNVVLVGTSAVFTPNLMASGADSFTVIPTDGSNSGAPATASLSISYRAPLPGASLAALATSSAKLLKPGKRGRYSLTIGCPRSAPACSGTVGITFAGAERVARSKKAAKRKLTVLKPKAFKLLSGASTTVPITLSADVRRALTFKSRIPVVVRIKAPAATGFVANESATTISLRRR